MSTPKCGTYGGYQKHKRNGEDACQPCIDASNEYHRVLRASDPRIIERQTARAAVRRRALAMLAERHPEELEVLVRSIYADRRTGRAT